MWQAFLHFLPVLPPLESYENGMVYKAKAYALRTLGRHKHTGMAEEKKAIHYVSFSAPFILIFIEMKFPQGKVHFALHPKLSIPSSGLVIGVETLYSEPECELQPIFTAVVWGVWDACEMAINDVQLAFWSHCGICMFSRLSV